MWSSRKSRNSSLTKKNETVVENSNDRTIQNILSEMNSNPNKSLTKQQKKLVKSTKSALQNEAFELKGIKEGLIDPPLVYRTSLKESEIKKKKRKRKKKIITKSEIENLDVDFESEISSKVKNDTTLMDYSGVEANCFKKKGEKKGKKSSGLNDITSLENKLKTGTHKRKKKDPSGRGKSPFTNKNLKNLIDKKKKGRTPRKERVQEIELVLDQKEGELMEKMLEDYDEYVEDIKRKQRKIKNSLKYYPKYTHYPSSHSKDQLSTPIKRTKADTFPLKFEDIGEESLQMILGRSNKIRRSNKSTTPVKSSKKKQRRLVREVEIQIIQGKEDPTSSSNTHI